MAVGLGGTILTSDNGLSWSIRSLGIQYWFYSIAYGNGNFIPVGEEISSHRGFAFHDSGSLSYIDIMSWFPLNGIGYGNSTFIAVGDKGIFLQGFLTESFFGRLYRRGQPATRTRFSPLKINWWPLGIWLSWVHQTGLPGTPKYFSISQSLVDRFQRHNLCSSRRLGDNSLHIGFRAMVSFIHRHFRLAICGNLRGQWEICSPGDIR